jgi:hypothetical protein
MVTVALLRRWLGSQFRFQLGHTERQQGAGLLAQVVLIGREGGFYVAQSLAQRARPMIADARNGPEIFSASA